MLPLSPNRMSYNLLLPLPLAYEQWLPARLDESGNCEF